MEDEDDSLEADVDDIFRQKSTEPVWTSHTTVLTATFQVLLGLASGSTEICKETL